MSEPNGDDPGGHDGGDEPRARDLAAQPAPEGGMHPLDPATIAKLASWFDLPSFDQVAEQESEAREKTAAASILETRAAALANIDPAFLAAYDGRRAAGAATHKVAPPEVRWERRMLAFDEAQVPPAVDEDGYPEVHIPNSLLKDVKTCTPQAFLRDLFRPETEFYIQMQPAFEDVGEARAPDPMAPIRAIVRASYKVGVVAPAIATYSAGLADLRAILSQPWAESKRERARLREAELLGKEAEAPAVATRPRGAP